MFPELFLENLKFDILWLAFKNDFLFASLL